MDSGGIIAMLYMHLHARNGAIGRRRSAERAGGRPMERCGLCGVLLPGESVPNALVRDSSAFCAQDPARDGKRRVVACSPEHLTELIEMHARKPFMEAELWAGKIARVMDDDPRADVQALSESTGLTPSHVQRGLSWMRASRAGQQIPPAEPDPRPDDCD
ncbi:hypothetical protein ACFWVB_26095 [Streptomyces microflavus]|uniref:hypothetical protein n=1 Tax=Streptomyces microflavus TaxID=1919 RepID=UPI0036547E32